MKQYNRIMLGEHGKFLSKCLEGNFIGINFLSDVDLTNISSDDEITWRKHMIELFLSKYPEKSVGTARNCIGFLWTVCYGLKNGDIVLASNGEGAYNVGKICGDYYYAFGNMLSHRRKVEWLNIVINRKAMSKALQNSSGSIGTCCNITKYASEIENLIGKDSTIIPTTVASFPIDENYLEKSLHRLLANNLLSENIFSKTIFHEKSNKADQARKWIHPDMVGVRFNEFQDSATRTLLKAADIKQYLDIYSYELKRSIDNDHQLKEFFFQALSNSSWANYGYLVAFEINSELREEMERLNRAFGIGIIQLSPFIDTTQMLFPATKKDVDYYTVDKLCKINPDFRNFMVKTARVLNAQQDMIEDVKRGLESFCDKGFSNDEELISYCTTHHIPL
ncbi:MAG: hypothetical protein NC117_08625 [Pseudoflavonifractor sp.]|nr:hypothetical protein [Pseudoflavonifractor sp.]